jgi:hypothetical protein
MKIITLTLFSVTLTLAQNSTTTATTPARKDTAKASTAQNKKPAQASKPSPAKTEPPVQVIPAGATLVEPNLYRYTDSDGKTWNYRQTPFGISKWEESSTPPAQPAAKSDPVVVTDLGDSVRFEKKTPFGGSTWVRRKVELTDEERALVADQQAKSGPSSANSDGKLEGKQ